MTTKVKNNDSVIHFLSSTRLTIFLFILLGILSIMGTIIIQEGTSEAGHIEDLYSATTIQIFNKLGFFNIYHSPFYVGALLILTINLFACTYRRIPRDLKTNRKLSEDFTPETMKTSKGVKSVNTSQSPPELTPVIHTMFKNAGYRLKERGPHTWLARRGTIARSGFYVSHMGVFIIILGAAISSLFGLEGMIWLLPGDHADHYQVQDGTDVPLGFTIQCEDFDIDYYDNGMVDQFRSELTLRDEDSVIREHTLLVNHPMSYRGFRFFQSSYQQFGAKAIHLNLVSGTESLAITTEEVPFEKSVSLNPDTRFTIRVKRFEPDFYFDQKGQAGTQSGKLNNPGILLEIQTNDEAPQQKWVFSNHPEMNALSSPQGTQVVFQKADPEYATGIQVARDPGSDLIWLGSLMMIGGLIIIFFISAQAFQVAVETFDGGSRVYFKKILGQRSKWGDVLKVEAVIKLFHAELKKENGK